MWASVSKFVGKSGHKITPVENTARPISLSGLPVGTALRFHEGMPLRQLAGAEAIIAGVRQYQFGSEQTVSYALKLAHYRGIFLSIANDENGEYLAISRELSSAERHAWFDPDVLSFFTEATSAKTLKCRVDLQKEASWGAAKYVKTIDFLEANVSEGVGLAGEATRKARPMHYSMLLDSSEEKAIEIEVYPEHGLTRVFATVFRPASDIQIIPHSRLTLESPEEILEEEEPAASPEPRAEIIPISAQHMQNLAHALLGEEEAAETATLVAPTKNSPKPDFKRLPTAKDFEEESAPLPAFLLEPHQSNTSEAPLLLDTLLEPEIQQFRCDLDTAQRMIGRALFERKPMRELLRDMVGLEPLARDEVIFELPLTSKDYETLAMRYQMRPDRQVEIRAKLVEELRAKLTRT